MFLYDDKQSVMQNRWENKSIQHKNIKNVYRIWWIARKKNIIPIERIFVDKITNEIMI